MLTFDLQSNDIFFWRKKKMKTCHNNFDIIIEWNSIFHNDKISLAFDMGIRKFHFVWQEWITFFSNFCKLWFWLQSTYMWRKQDVLEQFSYYLLLLIASLMLITTATRILQFFCISLRNFGWWKMMKYGEKFLTSG